MIIIIIISSFFFKKIIFLFFFCFFSGRLAYRFDEEIEDNVERFQNSLTRRLNNLK